MSHFMLFLLQLLDSSLRMSVPLVFAALGGLLSERSGVVNIALEGNLMIGALVAAVTAAAMPVSIFTPWLGVLVAMIAGMIFSSLFAFFVLQLRSNQIVTGMAMNLLATGLAPLICKVLYGSGGTSPALPVEVRFSSEFFFSVPVIGMFVAVALVAFVLRATRWGLNVRFAGEHPQALQVAGVSVLAVRWQALLMAGAVSSIGGAALSLFLSSSYARGMTAGRGFMALAALIFGKWRPVPTLLACLFFGVTDALQMRMQGVTLWSDVQVPIQFIQILPYIITIVVLAGVIGRSRAPAALGK